MPVTPSAAASGSDDVPDPIGPPTDLTDLTDTTEPPADPTGPDEPAGGGPGLTERERAILAFEERWWRHPGAKEQAVRDTFGLSATRYYQLLNALLDHPGALAAHPVLVARLRRLRASRVRSRRGPSS